MNLTINNQPVSVDKTMTILDAAHQNGIYIPSLCAHPELTPYGGCRLCLIEIEGRKGYPTACTTLIEEGMAVRTETQALQDMRKEMIQLILSEHPAACLICGDVEGCAGFQETIRKVGVTTGCRWCPKDKDCELQRVVDYLGIKELTLPGLYRELPIEKFDPFFDRDYNLCIYCGRCVRICNEHRRSGVLSLKQRGKLTTIGPASDKTHIEADCEFCGACVSVCPTGAMSEKSRKWWGVPEKYEPSVCPFCSMNCDLQVLTMKDKIVGTIPPGKPHESGGELCVKGRFCLSEMVNRTERVLEPEFKYPEGYGIVDWNFAFEKAKEILTEVEPGRSAVFISPGLTLEEIHTAKSFAATVLKTDVITSSCLTGEMIAYMDLAKESAKLEEIKKSDLIASFFFNGNYRYAPLTLAIKAFAASSYFQVGWIKDTTSRFAKKRFVPGKEDATAFLSNVLSVLENGKGKTKDDKELGLALQNSHHPYLIVGPEIMSLDNCREMLVIIRKIAAAIKAKIFMPNPYGNLYGLLAIPDLYSLGKVNDKIVAGEIDLLYFVGDAPSYKIPHVKHIIYQNAFTAPAVQSPDLILPASVWGETVGSYLGHDGSVKKAVAAAVKHGYSLSHEEIFSKIALEMGIKDGLPKFKKILNKTIQLPGNGADSKDKKHSKPGRTESSKAKFPYILIQEKDQHVYNLLSLGKGLPAFGELVRPGKLNINPSDAAALGLNKGDAVNLKSAKSKRSYEITFNKNIARGFLYVMPVDGDSEFSQNPCPVNIER